MTPDVQAVYDNYPEWFMQLLQLCAAVNAMPLDEMLTANIRMTFAGTYLGDQGREVVDPVATARQRQLIETTIRFRNGLHIQTEDPMGVTGE